MIEPPQIPPVDEALAAALSHPNHFVRAGVAAALGRTAQPEAIDLLVAALPDRSGLVQRQAIMALSRLGAPGTAALLALIQEEPAVDRQASMGQALAAVRSPEAVEMLAAALQFPEAEARRGAAQALGALAAPAALDALIQASRHADPLTRQYAAEALGSFADPRAILALSALLGEPEPAVREAAAQALGRIGGVEVVEPLVVALQDPEGQVRVRAGEALRGLQDPEAVPALLSLLSDRSTGMRQNAAAALGRLGEHQAVKPLYALAQEDSELEVRLTAAAALVHLGDPRGERIILRTLNAPNAVTRLQAAIALGTTRDPRAVEPLLEGLASDGRAEKIFRDTRRWGDAIHALASASVGVVPQLVEGLRSPDGVVQQAAAAALVQLGTAAVGPLHETLRRGGSLRFREQVVGLLGATGAPAAAAPLAEVLRQAFGGFYFLRLAGLVLVDPWAGLRRLAAEGLARLETPAKVPPLLASARFDPDARVRRAALRGLSAAGDAGAVLILAQVDAFGLVNRALVSVTFALGLGLLAGTALLVGGARDWALLGGVVTGAAFGVSDGLGAEKRPVRAALAGGALAFALAWLAHGMGPWVNLVLVGLPGAGALLGWGRKPFYRALLGAFVGVIFGFLGAGTAALVLR